MKDWKERYSPNDLQEILDRMKFRNRVRNFGLVVTIVLSGSIGIGTIIFHLMNSDMSETRLFLTYWPYFTLWIVGIIIGILLANINK